MIIVGSTALEQFNMQRSKPKDVDMWFCEGESQEGFAGDLHHIPKHIYEIIPKIGSFATADAIYTIKCSHFAWDVKWEKTKLDILWLKANYCELIPELYLELKKYWEEVHGGKEFLSLNKSKDEFFNDGVKYVYDHDYLHELVAHPYPPVYTHCLKDEQDVLIDKGKFDCMSKDMQIKMFKEEITVIAIERWLVHNNSTSWFEAYNLSLKKTITNLTKNWACDFIIHNLEEFIKPEYKYFKHALEVLKLESKMSKVDLKVFEEAAKELRFEGDLPKFVYELCEDDIGFGGGYTWENERPPWELRETDREEWERLSGLHTQERDGPYQAYLKAQREALDYEHLSQEGGGEGGGEYCYGVFRLKGKVYRAAYSYYSYNGHEYACIVDTLREVKPRQKTITVYE